MKTLTDKQYKELREDVERMETGYSSYAYARAGGMKYILDKLDTFK